MRSTEVILKIIWSSIPELMKTVYRTSADLIAHGYINATGRDRTSYQSIDKHFIQPELNSLACFAFYTGSKISGPLYSQVHYYYCPPLFNWRMTAPVDLDKPSYVRSTTETSRAASVPHTNRGSVP